MAVTHGLGDDQRPAIGRDHHPVREVQPIGHDRGTAVWLDAEIGLELGRRIGTKADGRGQLLGGLVLIAAATGIADTPH
jgi:hypothetical protein